jgi:adenine-specific DNA-methyltransferase
MILSYLGSKTSMLPKIYQVVKPMLTKDTVLYDVFSGSGAVSQFFKNKVSQVVSSDIELYAHVLSYALLKCKFSRDIAIIIDNLNNIPSVFGLVSEHFAPPKRLFFSLENAMKIDAIRLAINRMYKNKTITYDQFMFLLASLLKASSKSSNTCGTFRAHLKHMSIRSLKPLTLIPIHTDTMWRSQHRNMCMQKDAVKAVSTVKADSMNAIVYLDPPYNTTHYGAYYSFLNYLCMYDKNQQLCGTGILANYNKSKFGYKKKAMQAFDELFDGICARHIVMSYNSGAVLKLSDVLNLIKNKGAIIVNHVTYKAYKSKKCATNQTVTEYIIVVDTLGPISINHVHV